MPVWPGSTPESAVEAVSPAGRDHFAPDEIAHVLKHYPLPPAESIQEFQRGSRRSPKVIIYAPPGRFLLKRRAPGKNDPQRVAFSHALQQQLAAKHFPLPKLILTSDQHTFFQYNHQVYELFEFVPAVHYPCTLEATHAAGETLAVYHGLLLDFTSAWYPSPISYHRSAVVQQSFSRIDSTGAIAKDVLADLRTLYQTAADLADRGGLSTWPSRVVHADWHPGNLLFHGDHIAAVLDFDSARKLPLAIDLANAALQFSMIDGDENIEKWAAEVDQARYRRFLRGYRSVGSYSPREAASLPPLMTEALIAEAIFPIATTGTFGQIPGGPFLHMIRRKAQWLFNHAPELIKSAESTS